MVIDYKDVSFSFKTRRRRQLKKRVRFVLFLLALLGGLALATAALERNKISRLSRFLLTDRLELAVQRGADSGASFYFRFSKLELRALSRLCQGDFAEAQKILARLKRPGSRISRLDFLNYFLDRGRYRALGIYADHLNNLGQDEALWYRILVLTAGFEWKKSEQLLQTLTESQKSGREQLISRIHQLNNEIRNGTINFVFDADDHPLARLDLQKGTCISLLPGISFKSFTNQLESGYSRFSLTLDRGVQQLVDRLFKNYFGSFLLLNIREGSILAAYSKPKRPLAGNAVFTELYEPGSIVKTITLFSFLKSEQQFEPFSCTGNLKLGDQVFSDWTRHGAVDSLDDALARSCNVAFARLGMKLGQDNLKKNLSDFFFNSEPIFDRFLKFQFGTFQDEPLDALGLANLSVGLEKMNISTLHLALLGATVAGNGAAAAPFLIRGEKNVLGTGIYLHETHFLKENHDDLAFRRIQRSMVSVVTRPDGTGRRASTGGVSVALKTGTAGNRKQGLDSILMGFFPAERPQYAFAFRLQGAGKAEFEGARFLNRFLVSFYRK